MINLLTTLHSKEVSEEDKEKLMSSVGMEDLFRDKIKSTIHYFLNSQIQRPRVIEYLNKNVDLIFDLNLGKKIHKEEIQVPKLKMLDKFFASTAKLEDQIKTMIVSTNIMPDKSLKTKVKIHENKIIDNVDFVIKVVHNFNFSDTLSSQTGKSLCTQEVKRIVAKQLLKQGNNLSFEHYIMAKISHSFEYDINLIDFKNADFNDLMNHISSDYASLTNNIRPHHQVQKIFECRYKNAPWSKITDVTGMLNHGMQYIPYMIFYKPLKDEIHNFLTNNNNKKQYRFGKGSINHVFLALNVAYQTGNNINQEMIELLNLVPMEENKSRSNYSHLDYFVTEIEKHMPSHENIVKGFLSDVFDVLMNSKYKYMMDEFYQVSISYENKTPLKEWLVALYEKSILVADNSKIATKKIL